MFVRRLAALTAGAMFLLSACTTATPGASGGTTASGGTGSGCTVGVSWNNYSQERWKKADEPAMQKAIAAAGGTSTSAPTRTTRPSSSSPTSTA